MGNNFFLRGAGIEPIEDGAGTQAAAALSAPDHKYHRLFKQ